LSMGFRRNQMVPRALFSGWDLHRVRPDSPVWLRIDAFRLAGGTWTEPNGSPGAVFRVGFALGPTGFAGLAPNRCVSPCRGNMDGTIGFPGRCF
ncbi:MAG: hypothetical protein PHG30_06020, partial [Eubacteriales bacterium]|nr:hypothetical protein [Eubacteriales bacterium]